MLIQIILRNFRVHRDAMFRFKEGCTILRGANEAGKSTIAEAMAYALFGTEALRDALADVVTWGEKDSTLKVTAQFDFGGTPYTFARGKSGAECTWGDKRVTGQKEVSKFASELLGADLKLASRLMLASQSGLQGALADGPKATSEMIENMADFDLFEWLVDAMSAKLVLGAPTLFEERVTAAQLRLDNCPIPTEADIADLEAAIVAKTSDGAAKRLWIDGVGKGTAAATKKALDLAEATARSRVLAVSNLDAARFNRLQKCKRREAAQASAALVVSEDVIMAQRQRVTEAQGMGARLEAYRAIATLMARYPAEFWDEPLDKLRDAKQAARRDIEDACECIAKLTTATKVDEAKRVTASVCGFCDRDVSQFPEVAARNATLDANIAAYQVSLGRAKHREKEARIEEAGLSNILANAHSFQRAALTYAAFVEVDESVVPPRLMWKGEVPNAHTTEAAEKLRLSTLEGQKRQAEDAAATIRSLDESIADDQATITRLEGQLADIPGDQDLDALRLAATAASEAFDVAVFWVRELELQCVRHRGEIEAARLEYSSKIVERTRLASELAACQQQLGQLALNNTLLSKVRKARPIISDKLWNTVLHAVSTMFSGMRGEASLVSKDKDGFKVNGKPVTSLSGSTLDLLALAIRVAMIKTFLPHCSFLSLDEPFSASDEERTAKMLGFITTIGFRQTLLITHEDSSEAMAENLVML